MNRREQEKLLKESGFWLKKIGTRHNIWTNGQDEIALSKNGRVAPNTLSSFKSKLRKSVAIMGGK